MKREEIKVGSRYKSLNDDKTYTVVSITDNIVAYEDVNDYYNSCHIDWFCEKFEPCETKDALDVQVGGNHYKDLKIQPIEYVVQNKLGYLEGNVIKYVTRHERKNGLEDIQKAIHYLELIKKYKYEK